MRNSEFITGKVPITKEEVRAISISKLNLVNAKNLIDIGAGTGSVSVEAAYNYPNLK
ncbi:TPA: cobalt-precorrin-6Y C(15)-methyltransferase, partial [Clostridioides difficile]|nr:cobalt-precorrin-6Y C(15)-methyltransferase [Clostridioides difficile]